MRVLTGVFVCLLAWSASCQNLSVLHTSLEHETESSTFTALLTFGFSDEMVRALESGIEIHLLWELEIVRPRTWLWAHELWAADGSIVLGYRPLSQRFQLTARNHEPKLFATLPAMQSALENFNRRFPPLDRIVEPGDRIRFRIGIDIASLPPPLRMPAYLSDAWDLESDWFVTTVP